MQTTQGLCDQDEASSSHEQAANQSHVGHEEEERVNVDAGKKCIRAQDHEDDQQPVPKVAHHVHDLEPGKTHIKAIDNVQYTNFIPQVIKTPPPKTALLFTCIYLASLHYFFRPPSSGPFIGHIPTLVRGRQNRVLLFTGCFNPPHLHHLELLCQVFLKSGPNTIAAMSHPVGNILTGNGKAHAEASPLNKAARAELLQHDMLDGWCWPYMGNREEIGDYMGRITSLAAKDGSELSFVSLTGSDHTEKCVKYGSIDAMRWETKDSIMADLTHPSSLWDGPKLKRMRGCEDWRKILPAKGVGPPSGWKCMGGCKICEKAQQVWPLLKLEELSGLAADVLERCHQGFGLIYTWRRKSGGTLTFMPSSMTTLRNEFSSTAAREILACVPHEFLYENLVGLVINPALLLQILCLERYVPEDKLVSRKRVKKPLRLDEASEEDKYRAIHGKGWDLIVNFGMRL